MILHGEEDIVVPVTQSETFYRKLQKKGVDSVFYLLKNAGHGDDGFYQDNVLETVNLFLKRVLL